MLANKEYAERRALDEKEWRDQEIQERNRRHVKRVLDAAKAKEYYAKFNVTK